MSSPIHYTTCPACDSSDIHRVLASKDYTVSHKTFEIWECARCTMRFTQDVPQQNDIAAYYQVGKLYFTQQYQQRTGEQVIPPCART